MSQICLHNAALLAGYARMEQCAVLVEDGRILDVFSEKRFAQKNLPSDTLILDVDGAFLAPGFIDTHIHGFAGFGTEDMSVDAIVAMSDRLGSYGVSAFCPTIYPMDLDDMVRSIASCVDAMGKETGARVMGVHLEGPFLSMARLGVQQSEYVRQVDIDVMDRLFRAGRGHITNMTVAPELKGMRELALYCLSRNIVLQAGHTDASYENMMEGMQAGIMHSTHFFNAMSRLHHRDPGAVGAILINPELSCEIIADGKHVHPDLIRLLLRDKPQSKVVLVTDALKPTEQERYPLIANRQEVVLEDGVFHRKSDGVLAGSCLTMIAGVKNLASWGVPIEAAVEMASSNPARIVGLGKRGLIVPGYEADLVVFDNDFSVLATMVGGRFIKNELG
ncbi:MAG: N-acetylglucosamine-6-phosphate deacetylase [Spirochaetia bacterium]|nr:N-acetylglucosamine-6-phosphate deacetylase [Spirochaetia bacterium]